MKKMLAIPLAMSLIFAKNALAADEVHWTITGPNSVTINWHGSNAESTVTYGQPAGAMAAVKAQHPSPLPFAAQGTFWEAKLANLKANTQYTYKIGANPARTFKTPPALGAANFSIYAQGTIGDSKHFPAVGAIQAMIANGKPDFVAGLGDLTLGSRIGQNAVNQHFNDVMAWSQNAAYMPVWGDLDTINNRKDQFKNYKGRFSLPNSQSSPGATLSGGEDWYWFDYGNTRFITLPEPTPGAWADWKNKASGLMSQAQANTKIKFIVTFAHRPAYSSGHFAGSAGLKTVLDSLGDRFSKYVLNVNSHSSNYERSYPQHGVVHVTAGVGGRNLMQDGNCLWLTCAKPAWSAYRAMRLGALRLNFTNAGIKVSFICGPAGGGKNDVNCTKGSVIDSFNIASRAAAPTAVSGTPVNTAPSMSAMALAAPVSTTAACSKVALNVSRLIKDGGYSYRINRSFGGKPDNRTNWGNSKLRLFENNVEIGPAHSGHPDIRNLGRGRFSHWSAPDGSGESLRFSATNNTNPSTNGRSYSYCFGSGTPTTTTDTQAPSVPANMKATTASSSQISLSWSAASDNRGVSGYKVYRNNTLLTTTSGTSYQVGGLAASTSYSFYVTAYDAAGNTSGKSTTVSATTSAGVSTAPPPTACATNPTSSLVVNIRDKGARGNGSSDDTGAIQAAVDQVAGTGGTVYVPAGTYMVNTYKKVMLKSNITFRMATGAILKAIPNSFGVYNILRALNVSRINIVGGTLIGDRFSHTGSSGEHGIALQLAGASYVNIEGVTVKEAWGDGIYIGDNSTNVAVCSITAESNRRHGLTITSGSAMVVKNSVMKKSNGLYYSSGMDVEPNNGEFINNVKVTNSQFINNNAGGFTSGYPHTSAGGGVSNLVFDGNTVNNNGVIGSNGYSGLVLSNVSGARLTNNIVRNNVKDGISLVEGSRNNTVTGNTVTGSGIGNNVDFAIGHGILMWNRSSGNTVINNNLSGNKINLSDGVGGNIISPNNIN